MYGKEEDRCEEAAQTDKQIEKEGIKIINKKYREGVCRQKGKGNGEKKRQQKN